MNRLRSRALSRRTEEAPVDPMSSIGNLADAMLVLAVGIMLALSPRRRCRSRSIPSPLRKTT